jgi:hypothetical protein
MFEAANPAPTESTATDDPPHLSTLIEDAEYVCLELARGDAVAPEVLVKAKPYIDAVMTTMLAAKSNTPPTDAQYLALQGAMVNLMTTIAPVTVSSLLDTETSGNKPHGFQFFRRLMRKVGGIPDEIVSPAERFGDGFLYVSLLFLVAALACTLTIHAISEIVLLQAVKELVDPHVVSYETMKGALQSLTTKDYPGLKEALKALEPVLYGGLGACVCLLRALHKHIHERTFDRRYKPEYYNRAVLGVVGGGVVTLVAPEKFPEFGTAAVAFVVGYNTDLLFSLIERISNAIFPKVPDPPAASVMLTPNPSDKTDAAQAAAAQAAAAEAAASTAREAEGDGTTGKDKAAG